MADPVSFEGAEGNYVADGPIKDLPTAETPYDDGTNTGKVVWSCWELTDDELAEVLQTKRVWLGCLNLQPAVIVAGERPEELDQ